MNKSAKTDIVVFILALVLAVGFRTIWHLAPNVEIVTAVAVITPFLFRKKILAFILTLAIMVISDSLLGNTNIFLFTWSGFILAPLASILLHKISTNHKHISNLPLLSSGIISNIVFFLWTNFGVVVLTNMYSKDLAGLLKSYYYGLPFLQNQLLGTVVAITVFSTFYHLFRLSSHLLNVNKGNYKLDQEVG